MKTNITHFTIAFGKNCFSKLKTITSGLIIVFLFGALYTQAQNTNYYQATDIVALIKDMDAGTYDIYELTTPGGNYTITSTITLTKSCIIRGTSGLSAKPVVTFSTTSTTSSLSEFTTTTTAGLNVSFENLELNGINASTGVQPIFLLSKSPNSTITATNCYLHNFANAGPHGIFRIDGTGTSLNIEASNFNNCTGRLLNFYTPATTVGVANYGDITLRNNIFSNTTGASSIIYYRSSGGVATGVNATIDHCTFYKFSPTNTDGIFVFRTMTGAINATNCIFDQVGLGFIFATPTPTKDYCYLAGFATPPTGTNTFTTAPVYTDAANLNFKLTNQNSFICGDKLVAGCTSYNYVTGINDINSTSTVTAFGKTIQASEYGTIQIYNIQGKQLMTAKNTNILETDLENGIYLVRFTNLGGNQTNRKIVLQ